MRFQRPGQATDNPSKPRNFWIPFVEQTHPPLANDLDQDGLVTAFTPTTGNTTVTQVVVDFPDFTSSKAVTFHFYLYNTGLATHGICFDDISLQGSLNDGPPATKNFYRIRFNQ